MNELYAKVGRYRHKNIVHPMYIAAECNHPNLLRKYIKRGRRFKGSRLLHSTLSVAIAYKNASNLGMRIRNDPMGRRLPAIELERLSRPTLLKKIYLIYRKQ